MVAVWAFFKACARWNFYCLLCVGISILLLYTYRFHSNLFTVQKSGKMGGWNLASQPARPVQSLRPSPASQTVKLAQYSPQTTGWRKREHISRNWYHNPSWRSQHWCRNTQNNLKFCSRVRGHSLSEFFEAHDTTLPPPKRFSSNWKKMVGRNGKQSSWLAMISPLTPQLYSSLFNTENLIFLLFLTTSCDTLCLLACYLMRNTVMEFLNWFEFRYYR